MPKITIDGREIEVAEGRTIIQALDDAGLLMNGVDVPHYCWHPKLPVDGSCRLCQVEVEGIPKLQIACDTDRPVVIHSREADEDTIEILAEFEDTLKRRGVIHSFTSGPGLARYALDQGWCLGFNGITTFNKAENVRDIVRMAPIDQILLETDSPFLTPVPYRGKENAPFYLPFVAEKIAEVKELPLDEVIGKTYHNSLRTFFSSE